MAGSGRSHSHPLSSAGYPICLHARQDTSNGPKARLPESCRSSSPLLHSRVASVHSEACTEEARFEHSQQVQGCRQDRLIQPA